MMVWSVYSASWNFKRGFKKKRQLVLLVRVMQLLLEDQPCILFTLKHGKYDNYSTLQY
jgi:hypothetical protein